MKRSKPSGGRTSGKAVDPVVAAIEKFMVESRNMVPPSKPNEEKIYDTADLINVLESNNIISERRISMPPKKRKLPQEPSAKKPPKKGRLVKPQEGICEEPKWTTCRKLSPNKIRHVRIKLEHKHFAKAVIHQVLCDAVTLRNIVVKREIVDLTGDESLFLPYLKFAKSMEISDETVSIFDFSPHKARIIVSDDLSQVAVAVPDIRFHKDESCIDLTHDESDPDTPVILTSEKECANRILPVVHKFHTIYQANKKIEDALEETHHYLSAEEASEDYALTLSHMSKRTASVGLSLVRILSRTFMKNLNLLRFLEIIASKLDAAVKPQTLGLYLYSMLHQNRDICEGGSLTKELLTQLETYVANLQLKEENRISARYEESQVFTEEQLHQLRFQIEQYLAIVSRQEQLMGQYFLERVGADLSYRNFDEKIKCEVVSFQNGCDTLQLVKDENCVFDID